MTGGIPMEQAVNNVPSDIEIAQKAKPRPIGEVAAEIGLGLDDLDLYGKYKAKIPIEIAQRPIKGRLVLVTAVNPTPAGEGKSTVTVGLTQALKRLGKNALMCMREPSLGPVFGVKSGAAGGGYSQVLPREDINTHPRRITWPRTIDMNDRALRKAVIGLGGVGDGVVREEKWVIIPASEIMAIMALATSRQDLEDRLGDNIIGAPAGKE